MIDVQPRTGARSLIIKVINPDFICFWKRRISYMKYVSHRKGIEFYYSGRNKVSANIEQSRKVVFCYTTSGACHFIEVLLGMKEKVIESPPALSK